MDPIEITGEITPPVEIYVRLEGMDGYTPVKGVDYWTEEDKQEIIDEILNILGQQ